MDADPFQNAKKNAVIKNGAQSEKQTHKRSDREYIAPKAARIYIKKYHLSG